MLLISEPIVRAMPAFFRLFLFAFFVLGLCASAQQARVSSSNDDHGCTIDLTNLSTANDAIEQPLRALIAHPERTDSIEAAIERQVCRRFFIVVPSSGALSATLQNIQSVERTLGSDGSALHHTIGVDIRRLGIVRGNSVAVIVLHCFESSTLRSSVRVLNSCTVKVRFGDSLARGSGGLVHRFPMQVLNSEYLHGDSRDVRLAAMSAALRLITSDSTQLPIEVSTHKDGVARIRGVDILSIHPSWQGQACSLLHLRYKGQEQWLACSDSVLLPTTDLYFRGSHASGDTTWYSPFSNNCVYYLTLEADHSSNRYTLRTSGGTSTILNSLVIDRHCEEEHEYVQGYFRGSDANDFFLTETAEGEKWVWRMVNRYTPFEHRQVFVTNDALNDSVHVHIEYESLNDLPTVNPDKRVVLTLNGDVIHDDTFDGATEKRLDINVPREVFRGGLCDLRCVSIGTDTTALNYSESQAFDYYSIRARSEAYAISGSLEGTVEAPPSSALQVRLLRSERSVVLDSVTHQWQIVSGQPGLSMMLQVRNGSRSWSSCIINGNTLLSSALRACSIFVYHPATDSTEWWTGSSSDRDGALILQRVHEGDYVVVLANDDRSLAPQIQSALSGVGITNSAQKVATNVYYAYRRIQGGAQAVEHSDATELSDQVFVDDASVHAWQALVPLAAGMQHLMITSEDSVELCGLRRISDVDLTDTTLSADYIVITHHTFESAARDLATFRAGQGHRTQVVFVDDIYRQFGDGQKSPHAIRNFLRYAYDHWSAPRVHDVLLFGDASWDNRSIRSGDTMTDYVPSYGKPVSDVWFSFVDGSDELSDFNVGRLPVQNLRQAQDLVRKIKRYDSLPPDLWWKSFLFVSGGQTEAEKLDFLQYNQSFENQIYSDDYFFRSNSVCGDTTNAASYFQVNNAGYSVSNHINKAVNGQGVAWINFIGHGSPTLTDVNDWTDSSLANVDRPFVLATLSCQTAAFAEAEVSCIDENFLLAKDKGAIAAIGATGYGIPDVQSIVMTKSFFELSTFGSRNLGDILSNSTALIATFSDITSHDVYLQSCLLGDPLSRIPFDTVAHPVVLERSLRIEDRSGSQYLSDDQDSAFVHVELFNAGVHGDTATVFFIHTFQNKTDTLVRSFDDVCMTMPTDAAFSIFGQNGIHTLRIEVQADPRWSPSSRFGSVYTTSFNVFSPRPLPIDPFPYWNVSAEHPLLRVISTTKEGDSVRFEAQLRQDSVVLDSVGYDNNSALLVDECFVQWQPPLHLQEGQRYTFAIRSRSELSGKESAWLEIPFNAGADSDRMSIRIRNTVRLDSAAWTKSDRWRVDTTGSEPQYVLHDELRYEMRSSVGYGYYDSTGHLIIPIQPTFKIALNGVTFGDRDDVRGFNVRLVNKRTGMVEAVRNFDCFVDRDSCDTCFNGSGRTLVRFLRDSVPQDDYLFLAICGNTYGDVFVNRDLDSLHEVLKRYGSVVADSVVPPHSYLMIAAADDSTQLVERIRLDTLSPHAAEDTVFASGSVALHPDSGWVTSPVYGPARRWTRAQVEGELSDSVAALAVTVFGLRDNFSEPRVVMSDTVAEMDLSSIDATRYPYIQFEIHVVRRSLLRDPAFQAIRVDLEPLPELSVVPSSYVLDADSVLRGDTISIVAAAKRISPRAVVDSAILVMQRNPVSNTGFSSVKSWAFTQPGDTVTLNVGDTVSTLQFGDYTLNSFVVNPDSLIPELYRFNNSALRYQTVINDTEAPRLEVHIDSLPTYDGMTVARQPLIRCLMRDNSRMPIVDSWHLSGLVNDSAIEQQPAYRFVGSADIQSLAFAPPETRAYVEFRPTLHNGTNTLELNAVDYFGNETDSVLHLYVDKDLSVQKSNVVPNPMNESARIYYTLYGPFERQLVTLEIYDARGERVRSMLINARLGTNVTIFNGCDDEGRKLLQGSYYYRIFASQSGSIGSENGMFIILR